MTQTRDEYFKIIFLRHGNSPSVLESGVSSDFERPLSEYGKEAVKNSSLKLKDYGANPAIILTSPLLRAKETAKIVSETLSAEVKECDKLNGSFSIDVLWEELLPTLLEKKEILCVGHQPMLGALAGTLVGEKMLALNPGEFAVVKIKAPVPHTLYNCIASKDIVLEPIN
jgi:phosphohistidine phosphatase